MASSATTNTIRTPLLKDIVQGSVDYEGRPISRSNSGGWRSASFIIGVEVAERLAYYGISSNLITYLTGKLRQSTATAAVNVNIWSGTVLLLPLLGAFVADSYLGRYRTILTSSLVYILGLGFLTLSAMLPSFLSSHSPTMSSIPSFSIQVILSFLALYLVALGQGGHRPCVEAFGADQFDGLDPDECEARGSFFNWLYFGICGGSLTASLVLSYIQDNLSWGLGFGIPCCVMVIALAVFVLGTKSYRYGIRVQDTGAFRRIGRVFMAAIGNWRTSPSKIPPEEEACESLPRQSFEQFRFLNKALLAPDDSREAQKVCSLDEVEEAKALLRLVPIWCACLVYGIVFAQTSTFFTKQGVTMDRAISPGFNIPPASLHSFISLSIILIVPIYDWLLVPIARGFTRKPSGITVLQRIGTGLFLSILSMLIAAVIEMKRRKIAQQFGLVDEPNATIPMSIWWLGPQYLLYGVSEVFAFVGLQEFFYDQVPTELRSVGISLYLSIFGAGNFLSGFLLSAIEKLTGGEGRDSWFANNLNRGHLDYFYMLLAGLSTVQLLAYVYFARNYVYNNR